MSTPSLSIAVRSNSDDVFVAWKPSDFIPGSRGFKLERGRRTQDGEVTEIVENRVGFKKDHPKAGEHRPSDVWPFQRFNWTDHVVDVGDRVRYRVTAMLEGGSGPFKEGVASEWTEWRDLRADVGDGFSCVFNRGLVISQFVARYLAENEISPAAFKAQLQKSVDPKFRAFLEGDLGGRIFRMLDGAAHGDTHLHAALYELGDAKLLASMIAVKKNLHLILANGSSVPDGNSKARAELHAAGIGTTDRLLTKSLGLGHNKFVVVSKGASPKAVWTGSANWSTTGLCTQINNGLIIEDEAIAKLYRRQWDLLAAASPPATVPAGFTGELMASNDETHNFKVGPSDVTVLFTRTSDGRDMEVLRKIINDAKKAVLFLMFMPGSKGLHTVAAARALEKDMYVRGVVSSLGQTHEDNEKNVLDIQLVSNDHDFVPDYYTVVQPQGIDGDIASWIGEVTRHDFLAQVGHAIVHSKVIVTDPLSDSPVVVTGSHNFSSNASRQNDENVVIVRGHRKLAEAYATNVMSVYQHYRFRSYVREMLAEGKQPWSYLDDNDKWLKDELKSKALEIGYWA